MRLNQSEQIVLQYVSRDGYFTTDPGHPKRINNAAFSLVKKNVCTVIRRGFTHDEIRQRVGGGYMERTSRVCTTIRIALLK